MDAALLGALAATGVAIARHSPALFWLYIAGVCALAWAVLVLPSASEEGDDR
jgi:bacteriorhodopsin